MQPLDTFFFGQESKYRKRKGQNTPEADYFQRSAYFPQQTTLLGALRYCLLQMNGQIPINDEVTAIRLIGEQSFGISDKLLKFGALANLSSLFILDVHGKAYFRNPKDIILKKDKVSGQFKTEYLQRTLVNLNSSTGDCLYFPNYNEKDGLDEFLIHNEEDFLPINYHKDDTANGVFVKHEKVGITKKKDGESDEEGFYKQISWSLSEGFSFAMFAEIVDDDLKQTQIITSMGAEKSPFQFTFHNLDALQDDSPEWLISMVNPGKVDEPINLKNESAPKLVLLSDAYLPNYNQDDFQFAISDTKTFRFIQSVVKTGNKYYSSNPLEKKELKRSCKYNLLESGSVFFFKDETQMDDFAKQLKAQTNFYNIGYNHFLTIK
jgi:CRISPR-associated protein Cmr3